MRNGRVWTRMVVASLLVAVGACGLMKRGTGQQLPPAVLFFTNETLDQADVYAITSGTQSTRIGTVMSGRTDTLKVPNSILGRGDINVVVHLVARTVRPSTGTFSLHSGDQYAIRLPADARALVLLPVRE
jgi:hypothetical protein